MLYYGKYRTSVRNPIDKRKEADSNEQKNKFLYSNKDIIVTASVKDENQIASLVWREGEKISGNVAIEKNNKKQELKITIPAPATDCGETTRIFTATNVYGLSSEAEIKYIFDVTKPEFKAEYEIDGNQKYSLFGLTALMLTVQTSTTRLTTTSRKSQ